MECEILDTDEPLTSESENSLTSNSTVAQFLNVLIKADRFKPEVHGFTW